MSEPSPSRSRALPRKFLVVVDTTPESKVAIRFAARRAEHTGGTVTLVTVIPPADFQQWAGVERVMREEALEAARQLLDGAAKVVSDIAGLQPELVVREGRTAEQVQAMIKEDKAISLLVLGAGTSKEGPGPLVSAIARPGAGAYPIPVTVVPGSLTDQEVDILA